VSNPNFLPPTWLPFAFKAKPRFRATVIFSHLPSPFVLGPVLGQVKLPPTIACVPASIYRTVNTLFSKQHVRVPTEYPNSYTPNEFQTLLVRDGLPPSYRGT
jgi:hypothetical protein